MTTAGEAEAFARRWADEWNRRDVEAVLAHFEDGVVFSSPKALETVGVATVRGVAGLRAYWHAALSQVTALRFTLVRVIWDAGRKEAGIVYDREVNGRCDRAVEVLQFAPSGLVVRGEVFYGEHPDG